MEPASTDLYRHGPTGDLYAIRRHSNGELIGTVGPLHPDLIIELKAIPLTADNNVWIEANAQDLVLVEPATVGNKELAELAGYVFGLFDEIDQCEIGGLLAEAELSRLHEAIGRLQEMSAAADCEDYRLLLMGIEDIARGCRETILRQGTTN